RDGLEVLAALSRQGISTPVLLLTAKDAVKSRVAGLDAGADDYLVKPFAFPELSARIRALLRRGKAEPMTPIRIGTFEVDPVTRTVLREGIRLELTVREFEWLEYLARTKAELFPAKCWREMYGRSPGEPRRW